VSIDREADMHTGPKLVAVISATAVLACCGTKGKSVDDTGGGSTAPRAAVSNFVKAVRDRNKDAIDSAMEKLKEGRFTYSSLLADQLKEADDLIRAHAARAIDALGPEADEAAVAVVDALDDSNAVQPNTSRETPPTAPGRRAESPSR
jgi:hypothetical protein